MASKKQMVKAQATALIDQLLTYDIMPVIVCGYTFGIKSDKVDYSKAQPAIIVAPEIPKELAVQILSKHVLDIQRQIREEKGKVIKFKKKGD